jgi:hypothetical protein
MIEITDNVIQLISTGLVTIVSMYRSVRFKSQAWNMLGLFSGVYFLGLSYWLLFLLFYRHTPRYSLIQDISWYSSYLFLMLLIIYIRERSSGKDTFPVKPGAAISLIVKNIRPVIWLIPVFTAGMCIFFMQYGAILSNIIAAVLMTGLLWHAAAGFLSSGGKNGEQSRHRMLYVVTLLFCFTEYALWISSCFFSGDTLANPYYWIDTFLSLVFLMFIPALRKAVGR